MGITSYLISTQWKIHQKVSLEKWSEIYNLTKVKSKLSQSTSRALSISRRLLKLHPSKSLNRHHSKLWDSNQQLSLTNPNKHLHLNRKLGSQLQQIHLLLQHQLEVQPLVNSKHTMQFLQGIRSRKHNSSSNKWALKSCQTKLSLHSRSSLQTLNSSISSYKLLALTTPNK